MNGKVTILSVASLLGEAIRRIHNGLSVGELFQRRIMIRLLDKIIGTPEDRLQARNTSHLIDRVNSP